MENTNERPTGPKMKARILILISIAILGVLIFLEVVPYISGLLGAITLYVLLRNWMSKLLKKGWKPSLASLFLLLFSFFGILVPVFGFLLLLIEKVKDNAEPLKKMAEHLKVQMLGYEKKLGLNLASKIEPSKLTGWLSDNFGSWANNTATFMISLVIMYFLVYFMLINTQKIKDVLLSYVPLGKAHFAAITAEIAVQVRLNTLIIPLVAIGQGVAALIGFFIFGVADPFFWFYVVTLCSLVPYVGTVIGLLPVVILSLYEGNYGQAWGIMIYSTVVLGTADYLIRIFLAKRIRGVHPLITLFGVIIGVRLLGFVGLILGPLLLSLFFLMMGIYKKDFW